VSKQLDLVSGCVDAVDDLGKCFACPTVSDHVSVHLHESGERRAYCRDCAKALGLAWGAPACWTCRKPMRVAAARLVRGVPRLLCPECAAK
jgi:hypothetical protein